MRLGEGSKVEKRGKFKSTEQLDKEKMDAKWNTAKVREEMCLIHEAYQFFRMKYKNRYGDSIPSPNNFLKWYKIIQYINWPNSFYIYYI